MNHINETGTFLLGRCAVRQICYGGIYSSDPADPKDSCDCDAPAPEPES
jgi:hypothetical protein